jgi:hypothetical protein
MLLERGQRARADAALTELEQLLGDFPRSPHRWRLPVVRAMFQALDGNFVEAERLSATARALMNEPGAANGISIWAFQRFSLALLSGDLTFLTTHAAELLAEAPMPVAAMPVAFVLAVTDRRQEAARLLRQFDWRALDVGSPASRAPFEVSPLVFAAQVCLVLEDREVAERLYPPLAALAPSHRVVVGGAVGSIFGPVARLAGELALLCGRVEEAVAHQDEAIAVSRLIGSPALEALSRAARERALARLSALRSEVPAPETLPPTRPALSLERQGEVWAVSWGDGPSLRLKHSKGLGYLSYLLEQPGREVHVLELVGTEHATGDAGPLLDSRAKAEYRRRLDDLREELEEGERFGDAGRVSRAQQEIEAIAEQLAGAVGLGGRDRRAASDAERARVNVQRRLKDVVDRISAADPAMGRQLGAALKTGTYCSYDPL